MASREAVNTMVGSAESCRSRAMANIGLSAPEHTSLYSFRLLGSAYLRTLPECQLCQKNICCEPARGRFL